MVEAPVWTPTKAPETAPIRRIDPGIICPNQRRELPAKIVRRLR